MSCVCIVKREHQWIRGGFRNIYLVWQICWVDHGLNKIRAVSRMVSFSCGDERFLVYRLGALCRIADQQETDQCATHQPDMFSIINKVLKMLWSVYVDSSMTKGILVKFFSNLCLFFSKLLLVTKIVDLQIRTHTNTANQAKVVVVHYF